MLAKMRSRSRLISFHLACCRWSHAESVGFPGPAAEEPDHRHRLLQRSRRERPRRRAAEQRDELAAFHSITSSARQ
jgi:hypothetical protein